MAIAKSSIPNNDAALLAPPDVRQASARDTRPAVQMIVYAQATQRLLQGRPASEGKAAIIGLFGFAERLREVWGAARVADPYALWWLIKVEDAYSAARTRIENEKSSVQRALDAETAFDLENVSGGSPCRIELNFACPYAFWGARLLKSFDQLALATSMAERLGARSEARDGGNRFRCERAIRALFASPQGYRAVGVSKQDVMQASEAAIQARELMGDLPQVVLSGERAPALLPSAPVRAKAMVAIDK